MDFQDIAVVDVRVEPGASGDNYRFAFLLSRVPERFWPECFMGAYGTQSGLRRAELTDRAVTITLREAEAEAYATAIGTAVARANADYRADLARKATEEQQRLDGEQQRRARAEELSRQARHTLGI
jgi:hypothetical protein